LWPTLPQHPASLTQLTVCFILPGHAYLPVVPFLDSLGRAQPGPLPLGEGRAEAWLPVTA